MAGLDQEIDGEARPQPGIKIGFLKQEPDLDPDQGRCASNVEEGGCSHIKDALAKSRRGLRRVFRTGRRGFRQARGRAGGTRGVPRRRRAATRSSASSRSRRTRCACRTFDAEDHARSRVARSRRVALCRLLLSEAGHAAARRADQPSRRRVGGAGSNAFPRGVSEHRDRSHPRPLLPRQRRRLDPRARPRARHPVAGQLLVVARAEGEARLEIEEQPAGAGCKQDARSTSSSGCARTRRRARPRARPACSDSRNCRRSEFQKRNETNEIYIPPGRAPRRARDRGEAISRKGFGDRSC
jgi:energy-dependent translational throttle protein EttA